MICFRLVFLLKQKSNRISTVKGEKRVSATNDYKSKCRRHSIYWSVFFSLFLSLNCTIYSTLTIVQTKRAVVGQAKTSRFGRH